MIKREITQIIENHIQNNKILILQAPGKLESLELVLSVLPEGDETAVFDLNDKKTKTNLKAITKENFLTLVGGKKYIVLHEAQLIANLQEIIESVLFEDNQLNLLCICSYAPVIDPLLKEVLEQNGLLINMQAPTFKELANHLGLVQFEKTLEDRLIYGNYPAVIADKESAVPFLNQLGDDISDYSFGKNERVNKKDKFKKMLHYLAFNIGEQVSYNQVASKCGLDNETVERYITMLEKAFILIKLPVLSSEKRYELSKSHCFYFYDNGVRNAFVQNFNALDYRVDSNQLWKNWVIAEKMKKLKHENSDAKVYFWLTHTKQRLDFILVKDKEKKAYQILWDKADKYKIPALFQSYYPEALTYKINRASYWSFLNKD